MSKSRMIGTGNAGSNYNCNINLNIAGGTKKQGLPFSIGPIANHHAIQNSIGMKRNVIFTMNQLSGVGHTALVTHGFHPRAPYTYGTS